MKGNNMRLLLAICLMLFSTATYAQSEKDMIIASWKCIAVEQVPVQPQGKKQKAAPIADAPKLDTLRKDYIGVVYGFRNNGTLIINKEGMYITQPYDVQKNTLTITKSAAMQVTRYTVYTIVDLNYRTMSLQDSNGFVYRFERE